MKDLIDAKYSNVYDVLAYVAETHARKERVDWAKPAIAKAFTDHKQLEFFDFIFSRYI